MSAEEQSRHGRMILRPLAEGDEAELLRIHRTPEVVRWWGPPAEGFPWDEPASTSMTIVLDGAIAGLIQFSEEPEARYRHAAIDLFLDPALHGRGFGTEALRRMVVHLIEERGHHRLTIDPSVGNAAAIRSYEKVGFRAVGVMRRYERDPASGGWRDGLLMDLLADEFMGEALEGSRESQGGRKPGGSREMGRRGAAGQPRGERQR